MQAQVQGDAQSTLAWKKRVEGPLPHIRRSAIKARTENKVVHLRSFTGIGYEIRHGLSQRLASSARQTRVSGFAPRSLSVEQMSRSILRRLFFSLGQQGQAQKGEESILLSSAAVCDGLLSQLSKPASKKLVGEVAYPSIAPTEKRNAVKAKDERRKAKSERPRKWGCLGCTTELQMKSVGL